MEWNWKIRNKLCMYGQLLLMKMPRQNNRHRIAFSTNATGTTKYPHAKEWLDPYLTPDMKTNSKWSIYISVGVKAIKVVEENSGVNIYDFSVNKWFQAQVTKTRSVDLIKLQTFILWSIYQRSEKTTHRIE